MKIFLDQIDITSDILSQTNIPNTSGGIFPNAGTKWYNLIPIAANHPELNNLFSTGGLHKLSVESEDGSDFSAKIILRLCYSSRNS